MRGKEQGGKSLWRLRLGLRWWEGGREVVALSRMACMAWRATILERRGRCEGERGMGEVKKKYVGLVVVIMVMMGEVGK